jgi:glycosyltransferase involved in cell wall biosynthesis
MQPTGRSSGILVSPEQWEAATALPGDLSDKYYDVLYRFSASTGGAILLSEPDPRAAFCAASAATAANGQVYITHTNLKVLRGLFQNLTSKGIADQVLFFHGSLRHFTRDLPLHPLLVAARHADALLSIWHDLPAGATVLLPEAFSAAQRWTSAGFLEGIHDSSAFAAYLTTAKCRKHPNQLTGSVFRSIRSQLIACYFSGDDSPSPEHYTPVSDRTKAAREDWVQTSPNLPSISGWPYSLEQSPSLPDTLPNGESWPLISIVTLSYNQGKYLEETILSVAHQGYPRVEHIVMDGGSTDSTVDVLRRNRRFLTYAVSEKDGGQSNAINKGMARATGQILTWLNSDDLLAPGALQGIALGFHTSAADMVAGMVCLRTGGQTTETHMTCCPPGPLPIDDLLDLDGGWNAGKFFYQPEVMFSRDIWERAGGYVSERLYHSMDYDLWVRMAEAGARLHVIGKPVAWFRVHADQKTNAEEKFKSELSEYVSDYYRRNEKTCPPSKAQAGARRNLRIVMLNDHGFEYGAGLAHQRTAQSLANAGHEIVPLALRSTPGHTGESSHLTAEEVLRAVEGANPDMVITGNLHSAGPDPWQLGILAQRYPTLSILHDFWLLTGRCAYPAPCDKYLSGCDASCPTADEYPKLAPDAIAPAWNRKQKILFSQNNLMLLANSAWTAEFAACTLAIRGKGRIAPPVTRFRLGFPLQRFRPRDRKVCREQLGLPLDRFIVLLSGDLYDRRKNTRLALDAIGSLRLPDVTVVSLGTTRPGEDFAFDVRRPGHVRDEMLLARYYAAADVFVGPSKEETFGQVFIEAAACGTPSIGVRASGMQDAVLDGVTGLLIDQACVSELGAAILELYRKPELRERMGAWARIYVENEWSPEAAYYYMFQAWQNLGLGERLRLQPKIAILPNAPEMKHAIPIQRPQGLTMNAHTLGPEEGPHLEYSLPKFRWAYGPVSKVDLNVSAEGRHSLVLRYRNLHADQQVTLRLNGNVLGAYRMAETGIANGRLLCVAAELRAGANELEMQFTRWANPASEGRPLAAAITEISFLPDEPGRA